MSRDPWDDRDALSAAANEVRAVRERLLGRLAPRLDALHGTALGVRYWRVVAGPFLLYHLQQLADRSRREADEVLDEADFVVPRDTLEFLGLFQTERWDLQLRALCARAAGRKAKAVRRPATPLTGFEKPKGLRALAHGARRALLRAGRAALPVDFVTDGIYPLARRHETLAKALDFRLWPLAAELPERLRVSAVMDERRKALADLPSEGALEALAVASLPWCLPALFLEGFPAARARAQCVLGPAPKAMVHSTGVYYDELYKLCAAEALLGGARLVGVQHGGQYGFAAWSNPEWHERSIADHYMTWGWKEDAVTTPMPAPSLSPRPARAPVAGRVLLVSGSGIAVPHELFPAPMGPQWREFFAWRGRFLDALPADARAAARLRLFPKDFGWGEREEAAKRWPDLALEGSPTFAAALASAALVVTDHPGTTFFETLAWEIPGVHFWEDRLWESRPSAQKRLEPLRAAGIVHATPESAAKKAAEVRAHPEEWWASTKKVRDAFTAKWARADDSWPSEWAKALKKAAA